MHSAYSNEGVNTLYNLLFCDEPSLFQDPKKVGEPWKTLFAEIADEKALRSIAQDESQESRVRVLAHNRLHDAGYSVPPKKLLDRKSVV